ncbi:MAG: hypothetical protein AB7G88_08320, partial [Thermomicrobiales bacterium]
MTSASVTLHDHDDNLAVTPGLRKRQIVAGLWRWIFVLATTLAVIALGLLGWYIVSRGYDWLSWDLLTNMASRRPERSGLNVAIYGTLWIIS